MGLFSLPKEEDNKVARNIVCLRGCVLVVAVVWFGAALAAMAPKGSASGQGSWTDYDGWMDMETNASFPYVCQRPKSSGSCATYGAGWSASTASSKCWGVINLPSTYVQAENGCALNGGVLASLSSSGDDVDVFNACGALQPCWIGLKQTSGQWAYWADGTPVAFYTNWFSGSPSSAQDRAAVMGAVGYRTTSTTPGRSGEAAGALGAVINLVCLCGCCVAFFCSVRSQNNDGLLYTSCCDGCCCVIVGIIFIATMVRMVQAGSNSATVGSMIIILVEVCLLCAISGFSLRFQRSKALVKPEVVMPPPVAVTTTTTEHAAQPQPLPFASGMAPIMSLAPKPPPADIEAVN